MGRCELFSLSSVTKKRVGLNTHIQKFNLAKCTFLIPLLNYQAVSSDHKTTLEPLVDYGCVF